MAQISCDLLREIGGEGGREREGEREGERERRRERERETERERELTCHHFRRGSAIYYLIIFSMDCSFTFISVGKKHEIVEQQNQYTVHFST